MRQPQHRGTAGQSPSQGPAFPERYTDADGHMRPEIVDSDARAEAEHWRNRGITTTQLRRFFGAVRADERRFSLQEGTPSDSEVQVAMMMLKTKAHYTAGRDKGHDKKHQRIADFFEHHAERVKTYKDFGHFLRHFEAVTAYHKYFENKKRGN